MTTEHRPSNRGSRLDVSPLELRLYIVALLGAIYTITWRAIGGQVPTTESPLVPPLAPREPQRSVWIDNLPPDVRPTITLPPGWQRASEPRPSVAVQPARVVRVPGRHAPRVRTRSS